MMLDATSENRAHGWPAQGEIGRRDRQRRRRIASRAFLLAMGISLATGRLMAADGGAVVGFCMLQTEVEITSLSRDRRPATAVEGASVAIRCSSGTLARIHLEEVSVAPDTDKASELPSSILGDEAARQEGLMLLLTSHEPDPGGTSRWTVPAALIDTAIEVRSQTRLLDDAGRTPVLRVTLVIQ